MKRILIPVIVLALLSGCANFSQNAQTYLGPPSQVQADITYFGRARETVCVGRPESEITSGWNDASNRFNWGHYGNPGAIPIAHWEHDRRYAHCHDQVNLDAGGGLIFV